MYYLVDLKVLYLVADDSLANIDTHQTAQALKAGIEKIGEL